MSLFILFFEEVVEDLSDEWQNQANLLLLELVLSV
jgi:hypothetical protein